MEYRFTRGIRIKAIGIIVGMITAVVFVMSAYLIHTQVSLLKDEFGQRVVSLANNFARTCDYPALLEDLQALSNLSAAMLENKEVIAVRITNASGRVLFEHNPVRAPVADPSAAPAADSEKMRVESAERALRITLPIWAPQAEQLAPGQSSSAGGRFLLGHAAVTFSQDRTNALIRETIVMSIIIAAVVIGVTILLLIFLLDRFIHPLMMLVKAIRRLSTGKTFTRVNISRTDEIGLLVNAFNEMAEKLEANRRDLENHNQTLEDKIQERTEALSHSEARYKAFFESTGTGMIITEEDGMISLLNSECEHLLGLKRNEVEGKKKWHEFVRPADREKLQQVRLSGSGTPEAAPKHYEFQTINQSGQGKDIFITVSPIPGTTQKISSLIDVSEKKRLETGLQQAQKMEAIGTLAGGIAHDFNNLLMGIQGYASLSLMNMKKRDENSEALEKIEELVQSGSNLTRQILGFARGGKYEILPSNLNDIIEKTSIMFARTKREIQITTELQKDLWTADVDRGQIEQLLLNLYVNAWHAMPGGGSLYLETSNVTLEQKYNQAFDVLPGPYARVSVTDTGVGMDEKTRQRIFEPFFTTREMGRGTGLGLAMVYGIIKGHKGVITVYSEKGHGTSFHLYFPASRSEVHGEEPAEKSIQSGTETILIVEDEESVLHVSKSLLSSIGYRILTAQNGQKAINIYKNPKHKIDLVLLDMIMPGMSGAETFDQLKLLNPDVKVILCSGYSMNEQATRIMERGCRSFLQKPFTLSDLSRKVREALAPRRA